DEIEFLCCRLECVECLIDDHFNSTDDQAIMTQSALQHYCPTQSELEAFHQLKPEMPIEFFTKALFTEAEFTKNICEFPKNVYMDGCKAPRIPQIITKNISFSTKHDTQLHDVQEWCTEITCPVDFFYH
ncbi:hypothetical protein BG006_002733, partial [Podila minutissima]